MIIDKWSTQYGRQVFLWCLLGRVIASTKLARRVACAGAVRVNRQTEAVDLQCRLRFRTSPHCLIVTVNNNNWYFS